MVEISCSAFNCTISASANGGTQGKMDEVRMIRLLLVDDQQGIRRGLRMRLTLEPDITVVGEANTGEQVLALVQSLAPDIVLMDIEMPGMDGIAATAALQECAGAFLQSVVVMLSIHDDSLTRARAQAQWHLWKSSGGLRIC